MIHWLTFTVHAPSSIVPGFYKTVLERFFGQAQKGGGAMFYGSSLNGLAGVRVFMHPLSGDEHFTVSLPGQACEALTWGWFVALAHFLDTMGFLWKVSRLDTAFDDFPFTPADMHQRYHDGNIRTGSKVHAWHETEGGKREGHTFELGAGTSDTFLRVYDYRGVNRCELQYRHEVANRVFLELVTHESLLDAVRAGKSAAVLHFGVLDGRGEHAHFWGWRMQALPPAHVIPSPRRVSLRALERWLFESVAVALSYYVEVSDRGAEAFERLLVAAEGKRMTGSGARYKPLLALMT